MDEKLEKFQKNLNYKFKNIELLERALSHSSYANEKGLKESNERLEFLGDSVLGFVSAEYFFNLYKNQPEGSLTKHRAAAVCEKTLCTFSKELEIDKVIKLGKGEIRMGGAQRPSILADAFESVLAAIYLDGGIEPAKELVLRFITREGIDVSVRDYKTMLQEVVQKHPEEAVGISKQKTISKVAAHYMLYRKYPPSTPVRFDVVAIEGEDIRWHKNAFPFMG